MRSVEATSAIVDSDPGHDLPSCISKPKTIGYKRMRWTLCLAFVLVLGSQVANATLTDDVHHLLIAERFDEANARAQASLASARGNGKAVQLIRLEALNLLIDSARLQFKLGEDDAGAWINESLALTRTLDGEQSRHRAKLMAVAATRERIVKIEIPKPDSAASARMRELVDQSLELVEHGIGDINSVDHAYVYETAAGYQTIIGRYDQALLFLDRANALLKYQHSDWERRAHARQLLLLSNIQERLGRTADALASVQAASELAARVSGSNSLVYAETLTFLGQLQNFSGDYLQAKSSLKIAVAIFRSHPPPSGNLAIGLTLLANALRHLGDYDGARALYAEAITFGESATSPAEVARLPGRLDDFGLLEKEVGNFEQARHLFERALALRERQMGKSHVRLVAILNNLGDVALHENDATAAAGYFQRAADIVASSPDFRGIEAVTAREGLAQVALAQSHPAEADKLLDEAVTLTTASYGDQHPDLVPLRCEQALARARLNKYDEAYELAKSSERLRIDLLRRVVPALGETQALNLKRLMGTCNGLLLQVAEHAPDSTTALEAWQLVTDVRGLATRLLSVRLASARNGLSPASRERWTSWESASRTYADISLKSGASENALVVARAALDAAEASLGEEALSAAGISRDQRTLHSMLAHLPDDSVLVAYAMVNRFDLSSGAHSAFAQGHRLYALVVEHQSIRIVALGDGDDIGAKVDSWYRLLRNRRSDASALADAGHALRAAIWDPLAIGKGERHVFIVPDGALFRVNFAALPDGDGFLVEHGWRVQLLDSERDLIPKTDATNPQSLLLVGSPNFGPMTAPTAATQRDLCSTGFSPLPGTKVEMEHLALLWRNVTGTSPIMLNGRDATKSALRADAVKSNIVHIATHAAELDDACTPSASNRGMSLAAVATSAPNAAPRAVLALTGANDYLTHQDVDGILTSEEVVTMPLDHTQWVVLAACDTGLGDIVDGEGVFGFRRAFRLAGAHTVVMSLWKVDDDATAEWMEALYRSRLQQHATAPEAIAQAQVSVLSARRSRGESTHPFYWAAFVASGDWR